MRKIRVMAIFSKVTVRVSAFFCAAPILTACASPGATATLPAADPTTAEMATAAPTATQLPADPPTATVEAPTAAPEAVLEVANDPALGPILVGENGLTLYMFTKDTANTSNCTGNCLASWPPLLTQGNPALGAGVDPALVGSAPLADGSSIVTYNQMPLYYWYEDFKPGDTLGQGINDVWYVVSPDGTPVGRPGGMDNANANTNTNANANGNENENANDNANSNQNSNGSTGNANYLDDYDYDEGGY